MSQAVVLGACTLSVVLLAAAAGKLRHPDSFRRALASYRWLPSSATGVLVVAVPALEAACVVGLWIPPLQRVAATAGLAMLAAFSVLLVRLLVAGGNSDCGCFGSATAERVTWFSLVRNAALMGAAATVLWGPVVSDGVPVAGAISGIGIGLLLLMLDQGASLFTQYWFKAEEVHAR